MSKKEVHILGATQKERFFRSVVCLLGIILMLCVLFSVIDGAISSESTSTFFLKSAFVTDGVRDAPRTFIDESRAPIQANGIR